MTRHRRFHFVNALDGRRDKRTIARYAGNYGLSPLGVTRSMILAHWTLERKLREDLLASNPESRWVTFERAYDQLYRECPWLNITSELNEQDKSRWSEAVGSAPVDVYEIGSGQGTLLSFLTQQGHRCTATEITRERRDREPGEDAALLWSISDGVHLAKFESAMSYDVAISNQVIEHLHPDDLSAHLASVRDVLRVGGRYVVTTPHRHAGPADVSRVFRKRTPMGMHLREYSYNELVNMCIAAGLSVEGVVSDDGTLSKGLSRRVLLLEQLLGILPRGVVRRKAAYAARRVGFPPNIFLVLRRAS